jgi:hypothetical protein
LAAVLACLEPINWEASAIALNQNSQNLLLLDATVAFGDEYPDEAGTAVVGIFGFLYHPVPFFCLTGAILSEWAVMSGCRLVLSRGMALGVGCGRKGEKKS